MQPVEIKESWLIRQLINRGLWNINRDPTVCGLRKAYAKLALLAVLFFALFNSVGLFLHYAANDSEVAASVTGGFSPFSWLGMLYLTMFSAKLWGFVAIAIVAMMLAAFIIVVIAGVVGITAQSAVKAVKNRRCSAVEKEPSTIKVLYRSWKDKYCTPVIVVKTKE